MALLDGLIPKDANVTVTVQFDEKSTRMLCISLLVVVAIALLIWGIIRKFT